MRELICTVCGKSYMPGITGEDATKAIYKVVITTEKTMGKPLKVIKEYIGQVKQVSIKSI